MEEDANKESFRDSLLEPADAVGMLERELESSVTSGIRDPSVASSDEILRDIHKILTGNGSPQKGLIFKHAASRVSISILSSDIRSLDRATVKQIRRCNEIQKGKSSVKEIAEMEGTVAKKVLAIMWKGKSLIAFVILCGLLYINNYMVRTSKVDVDTAVQVIMDKKFEDFKKVLIQSGVNISKDIKDNKDSVVNVNVK